MKHNVTQMVGAELRSARNLRSTMLRWLCGCGAAGVRALPCMAALLLAFSVYAEEVHVVERAEYGETVVTLGDTNTTKQTGGDYVTQTPPTYGGYIFTHWTSTDEQGFAPRDFLGRAREQAAYHLYQAVTLTAHYLPESEDSDDDGIADGFEIYWYGNLDESADSDTDGDGYTFAQELAAGTNPLMPDRSIAAGVVYLDSDEWLYNPGNYPTLTIRSEPEGLLFDTIVEHYIPGETVASATHVTALGETFAYWTKDGTRVQDVFGRAVESVAFAMPSNDVTLVAVSVEDEIDRQKLYWYGTTSVSLDSDTDGDGYTFEQEIAAGTNPLMSDRSIKAGVVWCDSDEWLYNPSNYCEYVIRSEPEGTLFDTITDVVPPGTLIPVPTVAKKDGFAYWTLNGVRQADAFGRARETLSLAAPSGPVTLVAVVIDDEIEREAMYWYGEATSADSDTDGDGYTFAQEIAAGTNPRMPDRSIVGGVVWKDSDTAEVNLQPYEQMIGALVDDKYTELFTSPIVGNGATSRTFAGGTQIWPVVGDVNGDGLWDLIVCGQASTNVFVNVGSQGNPRFEERDVDCRGVIDLNMNSTDKLADMSLDVEMLDALSATTNGLTLLVSDDEGRIWNYKKNAEASSLTYRLLHKVWGGSFAGFAQGLMLAAVDWEDDGDLDCICGTAEGKLMLLRDPKVGRPTNLKADAGVDNVLLTWDPNAQSRVRGYKVYRAVDESEDFSVRGVPSLPTFRDVDLQPSIYAYRVSALSRFYTAGNSTPTEYESESTEPVVTRVGGPTIIIGDPKRTVDGMVEIAVSINNSMNYNAEGTAITIPYDDENLSYQATKPSGLSEKLNYKAVAADGKVVIEIESGEVMPGAGVYFTIVFKGLSNGVLMGDLDGNGKVDRDDLKLLAKLKSAAGRKYTDYQLKAGDFNQNGKLDNADYQMLRDLLKNKGEL